MNDFGKGIEYGKLTKREKELVNYLGGCIASWIEKHQSERGELMCALSLIITIMFTKQTPITDVEEQCLEIDSFCHFLKLRARNQ